jgi:hypothetical protein
MYKMDGSVFLMFQQFFETLPLVSVIEKQVPYTLNPKP